MKILRRFCSDEVMTLLKRMDTFPEEFVDSNKWNDFLPITGHSFKHFNLAERMLIEKSWDRLKEDYYPRMARQEIIKTLIREDKTEKMRPSSLLTIEAITRDALEVLEKEFKYADITKEK